MANNFKLTLDTLAPKGSITRPAEFLNAESTVVIDKGDATLMKVWFDKVAVGSKEGEAYPSSWELAATSKATAFTAAGDGQYYYHLVLKDDVANESEVFNSQMITFDKTAPVVDSFEISDRDSGSKVLTNERIINYTLVYSDNLSGVKKAYITGADIEAQELDLDGNGTKTGTITIKDSAVQGTISVSVKLVDVAENESEVITKSITLDTDIEKPVLVLETAADEVLPAYINYHGIKAQLTSKDADIVGYKIWEGAEPAEYTTIADGTALNVEVELQLSEGEGLKTVHAKIIDRSGTEAVADDKTVTIDKTAPVITLSTNKGLISAVEGYNIATLALTSSDAVAQVKSYVLKANETVLKQENGVVPASYEVKSTDLVEGQNTITLIVKDNAENEATQTVNIELDVTKPVISIPQLNEWYNAEFGTNLTFEEKNSIAKIRVWSNDKSVDTAAPEAASNIAGGVSPLAISAGDVKWGLVQSANNYLHIEVMDEVGNVSYLHEKFGFDNVKPEGSIAFEKTIYGGTAAKAVIEYEDAVSGVTHMQVKGAITNPSADWETVASSKTITLTSENGMKSIQVRFKDLAGNISDWIDSSNQCELDTTAPSAEITLYKADGKTAKPAISAEALTVVEISVSDDTLGDVEYRLFGDFVESSDEYKPLVMDAGKASKQITVNATVPAGQVKETKNFKVQIRDNAGNESTVAVASFDYDPTEPTADVKDLDHNRISKVHVYRNCQDDQHPAGDSYADEVKFTIVPSEIIIAYKVCAYLDEAAAKAGTAADAAIGVNSGSTNMSGVTNSSNEISCMIRGGDYEAALGEAGQVDGVHYVVVYVQNEAGLWSKSILEA